LRVLLKGIARARVFISDAYPLRMSTGGGKNGQCDEEEIAEKFGARIRGVGLDPGLVLRLYAAFQRSVAVEGALGKCPTIFTMGRAAEKLAVSMFTGASFVMGLVHPQYIIDYPMWIKKIHKRLDEIRSGAYDPDKTAWIDPTKILQDHDKAASQLRTNLLGTPQASAEGMALLDTTSAARADLQALKEELLGPLGELSNEARCLKLLDLVYYFADLAERGFPVPEHVFGPLREEVERITRVAVSLSAASRWRVAPLGGSGVAAMDCSSDAPDAASAIKGWHDAIPAAVRAAAREAACNARHVSVALQRKMKQFSDAAFLAEAAERDHRIALADARGSATRIFPPTAAPREQRDLVVRVRTPPATRLAPRRSKTPPCSRRCRNACSRPRSRQRVTRGTCASCGGAAQRRTSTARCSSPRPPRATTSSRPPMRAAARHAFSRPQRLRESIARPADRRRRQARGDARPRVRGRVQGRLQHKGDPLRAVAARAGQPARVHARARLRHDGRRRHQCAVRG